ncbi:MAG: plasmid pRiA4b ORF-3 family protein [Isosphaerales bacterium]
MPAKKRKQPDETFPLKLTDKQWESLGHATRLTLGLKKKIEEPPGGTRALGFTETELERMYEEIDASLAFVPPADKKRLNAVFDKIGDFLVALDEKRLQEKRQAIDKSGAIYQFKVTLEGSAPPIWRRIQVPDFTLGELHDVLQVIMGWDDSHPHQFIIRGEYYGPLDPDDMDWETATKDEEEIRLSQVARMGRKVRFTYVYDFGDSWQHEIVLEQTMEPAPKVTYPRCVAGARACPPDDVGGSLGYADFLEAIGNPKHENHRDMKEWIGGKFDPEKFALGTVNRLLRRL